MDSASLLMGIRPIPAGSERYSSTALLSTAPAMSRSGSPQTAATTSLPMRPSAPETTTFSGVPVAITTDPPARHSAKPGQGAHIRASRLDEREDGTAVLAMGPDGVFAERHRPGLNVLALAVSEWQAVSLLAPAGARVSLVA